MQNEIMATVLVALMFAFAASTPYVFGPPPTYLFKTLDNQEGDPVIVDIQARRGR